MSPADSDLGLFQDVVQGSSAFHARADVSSCVDCGRKRDRSYLGRCGDCARLYGITPPEEAPTPRP